MTAVIQRIDPTFLRRGAVIDLNDLENEQLAEHFKMLYLQHMLPRPNGHPMHLVIVDHLERTDPDEFYIIPQAGYTADQAHALGLAIDTRFVRKVRWPGTGQLVINEPVYEIAFGLRSWAINGESLSEHYAIAHGHGRLRQRHQYVSLNNMAVFLTSKLVQRHPRLRGYINPNHLFDYMVASKTLHHFGKITPLIPKHKLAQGELVEPHIFVDIKAKALNAWLKRNQSALYQSATRHQAVLDGMQDQVDTNVQALYDAEAKTKSEETAAEADALEQEELEELLAGEEDDGDEPDTNYLPTPEPGQGDHD